MLKIKVEGKELATIIQKAVCNMNKKAAMPILRKVLLIDDGNVLTAYTSDLEGYLQANTVDYESISSGAVGIDVEDLKVLLKMDNMVTIIEQENNILVQCGNKNISLIKYDISDFPEIPEGNFTGVLEFLESEFAETINTLTIFTSDNENNKVMQCFHFNITESRIEALDGRRIGLKQIEDNEKLVPYGKIMVHNSMASDLKKALDKKSDAIVTLACAENYIRVSGKDFTYYQKKIDGEYFRVGSMLSNDFDISFNVDTEAMLSHMKYYTENVIARSDRTPIIIKTENEEIVTYGENTRFEVSDKLEIKEHIGGNITIGFNPYVLVDALKMADSDSVTIGGNNPKSPFFITANKYSFLVLPVKVTSEIVERMEKCLARVASKKNR